MKNIIWQKPTGIAVTTLVEATDSRAEAAKLQTRGDVPSDWVAVGFDIQVPKDRGTRDDWQWNGSEVISP